MLSKIQKWFAGRIPEAWGEGSVEYTLQLAAAVLLLEVAEADFQQQHEEHDQIVSALAVAFDLSEDRVDALLVLARKTHQEVVSLHAFVRLLNEELSYDERFFLLECMWRVAFADSHIDKYEEHIIRKIADLLYIPHRDFIRAKHSASNLRQL